MIALYQQERRSRALDTDKVEESTSVSWLRRLLGKTRRVYARPDWASFAGHDWAARIFETAVTDDFHAKQGRSTGRLILNHAGATLSIYLKRHYNLPRWRGLLATLWPRDGWSPALQEFRHLQWAHAQGLPVPRIVAAGEFLRPLARLQSFLAIEELVGMLPLHQAIPKARQQLEPSVFYRWKMSLIEEMARLTRFLHERLFFHKDLYLCHFYMPEADTWTIPTWRGHLHMIDFHRLGRHSVTRLWWRIKDLAQLLYSSAVEGVDARDRLRFWRCYLLPRKPHSAKWLRWCVRWKSERYRRHNERKLMGGTP